MREYKVLEDTPRISIRGVPMGFVHIRGKAAGEQLLSSPLSNTQCCFYKVEIEQWKSEGNSHKWVRCCTDCDGYQFHLDDGTGKILVDAHSAEYDLPLTATREVSSATASNSDDAKLLEYVRVAQAHSLTDRMGQWVDKRFDKAGASDNPQLQAKRQALRELFDGISGAERGGKLPFDAVQKLMNATGPLSDPEKEQRRQMMIQNAKLAQNASESGLLDNFIRDKTQRVSGRFRLNESVIQPGLEYLVSGTCIENCDARTAGQDRSIIAKGKNEPTFVISTKTDAQIHRALEKRALLMIFGGALLALASAAGLLLHLGLF